MDQSLRSKMIPSCGYTAFVVSKAQGVGRLAKTLAAPAKNAKALVLEATLRAANLRVISPCFERVAKRTSEEQQKLINVTHSLD